MKHTSSLLNFQSTHNFASHPRLLIHNPGNKKRQKCPAGLLNIHTIQNLSPRSKNFQLLFTSRTFCLEYVPFIQFVKVFKKIKQRNYHQQQNNELQPWNYNLLSLLYHGTSTEHFCKGLGRITIDDNHEQLRFFSYSISLIELYESNQPAQR